ncbi:MAG: hypothetical protein ACFCU1_00205 [Sumerlaeia bacterium]
MTQEQWYKILVKLEVLFEGMSQQQRDKLIKIAHQIRPDLSEDDLRDPHSFPEVTNKPHYAFEDGILAGIISAQMAVLSEFRSLMPKDSSELKGEG